MNVKDLGEGLSVESEDTLCSSFDERDENGARNEYETKNLALSVECEAVNCRFNEDLKCRAKHITICGNGASDSGETNCASFEAK
jgi:hypothetical protein